jgi:hypothetical protein
VIGLALSALLLSGCGSRNADDEIFAEPNGRGRGRGGGGDGRGDGPGGGRSNVCAADAPDADCCTYGGVDVPAQCEMRFDGPYYTCPSGALRFVKGTACKSRQFYFACFERAFCQSYAEVCLGTLGQGAFARCVPIPDACRSVENERYCECLLQQHQQLLPLCDLKVLSCDVAVGGEPRINAPCTN